MRQVMPGEIQKSLPGFAASMVHSLNRDRVAGRLISVFGPERALQFLIDHFRADEIVKECEEFVELESDAAQFE
jgi:hypothetical protein